PAGESATGRDVVIPLHVQRGSEPGPVVAVTATVHGDEINGMGVVRRLILDDRFDVVRGTLILVPVVNVLGFERKSRYMPDRRDLNRSFPGTLGGSLTSRFARAVFDGIVRKADYLIDLHAAAASRTNYPNVRADLDNERVYELASLFGAELTVHGTGPEGSLRRAAVEAGVATIILEAGETWKIEPAMVEVGVRGVRNVLAGLGMLNETPEQPAYRVISRETSWVRSGHGGILRFHVAPGDDVDAGQPLATATTLLGKELATIDAPNAGVVLGMTTLPAVVPGDPVCHIATAEGGLEALRRARLRSRGGTLDDRLREDLATNIVLHDVDDAEDV
ncbi:MAG: succinylglutamate desuccinylase/aspartoacylase family protein, partial [Planctomycetota bacterium]